MRRSKILRRLFLLAFLVIATGFTGEAYCQADDIALLIQQSPAEGGSVSPGAGVHHFESGSDVTLTAVARPGYQFVYWLGDVSDMTSNSTVVYLDAPKIVIAVFERVEYEVLGVSEMSYSAPAGGGLRSGAADYSRGGYTGGGAKRPHKYRWPTLPEEPEEPEEDLDDYFPAPDEPDDYFPVPDEPVPEPATGLLLGLGSLGLLRRRKQK